MADGDNSASSQSAMPPLDAFLGSRPEAAEESGDEGGGDKSGQNQQQQSGKGGKSAKSAKSAKGANGKGRNGGGEGESLDAIKDDLFADEDDLGDDDDLDDELHADDADDDDLDDEGADDDEDADGDGEKDSNRGETRAGSKELAKLQKQNANLRKEVSAVRREKDTFINGVKREMAELRASVEDSRAAQDDEQTTEDLEAAIDKLLDGNEADWPTRGELKKTLKALAKKQASTQKASTRSGKSGGEKMVTLEEAHDLMTKDVATVPGIQKIVEFAKKNLADDTTFNALQTSGARATYAVMQMTKEAEEAAFRRGVKKGKSLVKTKRPPQGGTRGNAATDRNKRSEGLDPFAEQFLRLSDRLGGGASIAGE